MTLSIDLRFQIDNLWNKFWAAGLTNPLTAIEQMSYLIFMKRLEDLDNRNKTRALQRGNVKYTSIFQGNEDCRWSEWKHYKSTDMLEHVSTKVFKFIKTLDKGENSLFSRHMEGSVFVIVKASLLQEAVSIIDNLNISARNQDIQGDIYEYLLSQLKTSGMNGQFRTPRHIIKLIVTMVDPKLGNKICDPACGTAGFLIGAYEHILAENTSPELIKAGKIVGDKIVKPSHWDLLKRESFYGFEIEPSMIRISLMNMILHGIEHANIHYADSLSKQFTHKENYDIVLANPPFTGHIDESSINDEFKLSTSKTELLFLELCLNLAFVGGVVGIIVPTGLLSGQTKAHKQIRQRLLEKCQIEAVIYMPSGVFKPYAGVETAILIITKGGFTKKVWFYEMQSDGYTLDDKREFIDGRGDIPDIIECFKEKKISSKSMLVDVEEIKDNYYILLPQQYMQIVHSEKSCESVDKILTSLLDLEIQISNKLNLIKSKLK